MHSTCFIQPRNEGLRAVWRPNKGGRGYTSTTAWILKQNIAVT
jgi:hypothetical protein